MARLIIGENELLPGTQVITESGVTITPKDGLEVLLAIDDVTPASVTLDSGTSLSQKVHVMNKSGNSCVLVYLSQNGSSSITLSTNQSAFLVWTGEHWNATFSGLITGTDADGNSINYDSTISLDIAPRSRDDYSTSEIFTGQYWIDGKKIYRKVLYSTGVRTYTTDNVRRTVTLANDLTNVATIINYYGCQKFITTTNVESNYPIPMDGMLVNGMLSLGMSIVVVNDGTVGIVFQYNTNFFIDLTKSITIYLVLEYTKTTD